MLDIKRAIPNSYQGDKEVVADMPELPEEEDTDDNKDVVDDRQDDDTDDDADLEDVKTEGKIWKWKKPIYALIGASRKF